MKMARKSPKRSTTTRKTRRPRGNRKIPYLAVAVLCEKVLQENDGVASLIRLVDKANIVGTERTLPAGLIELTMFLLFKSGDAKGRRQLRVVGNSPSGEQILALEKEVDFVGNEHGVYVSADIRVLLKQKGLYWFDVTINGEFVTKIPLRIEYRQQK